MASPFFLSKSWHSFVVDGLAFIAVVPFLLYRQYFWIKNC